MSSKTSASQGCPRVRSGQGWSQHILGRLERILGAAAEPPLGVEDRLRNLHQQEMNAPTNAGYETIMGVVSISD